MCVCFINKERWWVITGLLPECVPIYVCSVVIYMHMFICEGMFTMLTVSVYFLHTVLPWHHANLNPPQTYRHRGAVCCLRQPPPSASSGMSGLKENPDPLIHLSLKPPLILNGSSKTNWLDYCSGVHTIPPIHLHILCALINASINTCNNAQTGADDI